MAVGRLAAMATGPVRAGSGIEPPTRVAPVPLQPDAEVCTSFWSKIAPCTFDFVRLAHARVHCGATTMSRSVVYGDGILEREVRGVGDFESASSRPNFTCFEAEADVGRVECSGKGCRPVYEEASSFLSMAYPVHEDSCWPGALPSLAEFQITIQPQIPRGSARESRQGQLLNQTAVITRRSFEVAMQDVSHDSQHLSDFAVFSWKSLGDMDKAEELYQEALDASPDDTDILASYANFLWQCDE